MDETQDFGQPGSENPPPNDERTRDPSRQLDTQDTTAAERPPQDGSSGAGSPGAPGADTAAAAPGAVPPGPDVTLPEPVDLVFTPHVQGVTLCVRRRRHHDGFKFEAWIGAKGELTPVTATSFGELTILVNEIMQTIP